MQKTLQIQEIQLSRREISFRLQVRALHLLPMGSNWQDQGRNRRTDLSDIYSCGGICWNSQFVSWIFFHLFLGFHHCPEKIYSSIKILSRLDSALIYIHATKNQPRIKSKWNLQLSLIYCRSLIKVKFPTDQFRPALGSRG